MTYLPRRCEPGALSLREGFIHLARVDHHKPDEEDFGGHCGICGALVWTDQIVERFRAMKPMIPALCCLCSGMSRYALDQAFPGLEWDSNKIPDLAKLGRFN